MAKDHQLDVVLVSIFYDIACSMFEALPGGAWSLDPLK